MITATHFIEQVRYENGFIKSLSIAPIKDYKKNLAVSEKFNINTIAVFKIARKVKPVIAHYDYDLKTTIVE